MLRINELYTNKLDMKKQLFLAILAGATTVSAVAQISSADRKMGVTSNATETIINDKQGFHPTAPATYGKNQNSSRATSASSIGLVLGTTIYDLQSNSSIDDRFVRNADGTMSAVYTMSKTDGTGGYADRGSGYLFHDGTNWTVDSPNTRLESERMGWPSIVVTSSGKEIVLGHTTTSDQIILNHRATKGTGAWTEVLDPNGAKAAQIAGTGYTLWPRMAVGGSNGESLHLIALSEPVPVPGGAGTFNGQRHEGLDGAILYSRSLDGGATWDKKSIILPGLDSSKYDGFNADSYAITAKGDVIAIAVFHRWNSSTVLKSMDNGNTWTEMHPIKMPWTDYILGDFIVNDTVMTADNTGDIMIDNNNEVHVMFGSWTWTDDDTTLVNGAHQYTTFPFMNGLHYWKESYGEGNHRQILSLIDQDGDPSTLNILNGITGLTDYGAKSMSGYPSLGKDANGSIFATFMGIMESESASKPYNDGINHYRHQFVIRSADGGCTWGEPLDLTDDGTGFEECVYGALAENIDDSVRVIYMEDFSPGTEVGPVGQGGNHGDVTNLMVYVAKDKADVSSTPVTCLTVINGEKLICAGDTLKLDASPSCGSAYSWSTGETTASINVTTTGVYTCDITTPCGVITEEIEISTPAFGQGPSVTLASDMNVLCPSGSSTTLRVNHSSIGSSGFYEWNNSGNVSTIDTFDITSPGTYSVKVQGCGGSSNASITIGSVTAADASISGTQYLCSGDTAELMVAENPDGAYSWTQSGSSSVISNATSLKVTATGTYIVEAFACNGLFSAKDSILIDVEPAPVATLTSAGSIVICKGASAINLIASGQPNATFKWEDGSTNSIFKVNSDSVHSHGYSFYSYNACGDSLQSNVLNVEVKDIPAAISISKSENVFTASSASAIWYYRLKGTSTWKATGTTGLTYEPTNLSGGDEVTARIETNGCESLNSNIISVTVGISDLNNPNAGMLVFPNPSNGNFNISFTDVINMDVNVSIRNLVGQEVLSKDLNLTNDHVENFNLVNLESGVYILTVNNGTGTYSNRIIVE